jgi:RNase H-fold protein (predicted Holliday junction resolvase)
MTPYGLFSFCQNCQQRSAGSIENFNEGQYYPFYCSLRKYLMNDLKLSSDNKIKKFIEVCAKYTGNHFDPFQLNSPEYLHIFTEWYRVNANDGAYYNNIKESFGKIYKFCSDKELQTLEEYVKKWSVSHIISGILNENIAFALGVHKLPLTRPEVMSINKKFLKHVKLIDERISRDLKLQNLLASGIEDVRKKLIWRNEKL